MAEAVGIVLGVLPLTIEVAKRYKWMYKVFSRYKNCGSEVTEFQRRLHVEQTSFCNEVQILLSCLTSFDTANKILAGDDHSLASDTEADEKFAHHSGESGIACRGIIETTKVKLSTIETFLEKSIPGESKQDLIKRTRRKLKFSFSESHLESNLTELAKLNADLVRISGQISRLKHLQVDAVPVAAAQKTKYRVDQYEAVRKAAVQLFEALGKACNVHPEHWAQVRVEPEHVTAENGEPPLIRFIMAFTQSIMTNKTTEVAPVWVVIESILSNSLADESLEHREEVQHALSHLKMTLKRVNDSPPPALPTKKLKTNKGVRFVSPEPEPKQKPIPGSEHKQQAAACTAMKLASQVLETSLPDFSKDHNLCLQIQQSLVAKKEKPHSCIGYLRKGDSCKHRVFSNSNVVTTQPSKSTSLANLIDLVSRRSYAGKLLECESLKLARQLASAVLQFHTTPLTKSSWRSEDVIFFGINETHQRLILMSLHLNVQVQDTSNSSLPTNTISHRALTGNPCLFGLGIILIELAYQVPFRSLRSAEDLVNGQEDQTTDFRTAERIAWSIGNGLGKTYGTIVRKCLFCSFGEDTKDLGDLRLQTAFHRDVLCELEKLEDRMKQIQLGD